MIKAHLIICFPDHTWIQHFMTIPDPNNEMKESDIIQYAKKELSKPDGIYRDFYCVSIDHYSYN
jgi:hypothetical protein